MNDSKFEAAKAYGIKSIPTNVVIDKDGNVAAAIVGSDEAQITAAVKKAQPKK